MCGLAGIIDQSSGINRTILKKMGNSIRHRGPDDEGIWISDCKTVGFAHQRLSIIDLSLAGHQPMHDSSGRFTIVFNGEIYNYIELKKDLISKGHKFCSSSDTEVLLNAYFEWGSSCVKKLNGMFAFSIYDALKKKIFMARDRAGEKPMYYSRIGNRFYFASELKAIMADHRIKKKINKEALDCYLAFRYVPSDLCILKGINKLPPAHALEYDISKDMLRKWKYWELPSFNNSSNLTNKEYLDELETLLLDAVNRQLISDVPLGVLLSGGIDSSLITALASRSTSKLKTFTISFPGHGIFDESKHASIIADRFSTEHTELECPNISVDLLNKLAIQYDEPMADSSMLPTFLVTKLVKNHCTVGIGGDGADELFGGYHHYSRLLWTKNKFKYLPSSIKSALSIFSSRFLPLGIRGRIWLQSLSYDLNYELPLIASNFDISSRKKLLQNYNDSETLVAENIRFKSIPNQVGLIQRATRVDFSNYLPEDILVKVDRASMLNSLEIRAPFLDYRIIEFAFRDVPSELKTSTNNRKIILKELAKKLLPKEVDLKRKQGFAIPLDHWLKGGDWYDYFHSILIDNNDSLFNKSYVESLLRSQKNGFFNGERLFSLVLFEKWRKSYSVSI